VKTLPTTIASPARHLGIAVLEFEGAQKILDRDAVGFYYTIKRSPDQRDSRLAVLFSGTVFYIDTDRFGIPETDNQTERFTYFAEAAIGDYLDEHGLPEHTPSGTSPTDIECFSPHFQGWRDRRPADDDEIEAYLRAHVFWAWKMSQKSWEIGPPDRLRLNQPMAGIERLVNVNEGHDWTVVRNSPNSIVLTPLPAFLRRQRERTEKESPVPAKRPTPEEGEMSDQSPPEYVFVDEVRIADLRRANSSQYDLRKLIALCEELNQCYRSQCYHAVAALVRAVLDHVPPLFGVSNFGEVSNNYGGTRSFKECMMHLEKTARKIGDMHLHTRIRPQESLPSRTQVNFSNDIDVLLAEVVRLIGEQTVPDE
jgi:hypothetical protein